MQKRISILSILKKPRSTVEESTCLPHPARRRNTLLISGMHVDSVERPDISCTKPCSCSRTALFRLRSADFRHFTSTYRSGNHPFYKKDGGPLIADAGRVDRFKNKYGSLGGLGEVPGAGGAKEEK